MRLPPIRPLFIYPHALPIAPDLPSTSIPPRSYDFIMYGDSIVSLAGVGRGAAVWADFFADNMTSAPLGIRGNNVEVGGSGRICTAGE